jgi:glycosyltransferase involved in cell wall biosynthesis
MTTEKPPTPSPGASPARSGPKVLVLITEDWFCLSHFQPLLRLLVGEIAREVVVATRCSGRECEIAALGARVVPFDLKRASLDPLEQARTVQRIAALMRREAPDIVHVIAMQPMVLASIASGLVARKPAMLLHLTGLGFLAISEGRAARIIRPVAMTALGHALKRRTSWLVAENPDDVQYLVDGGADPQDRVTVIGGAGLDPAEWPAQPDPGNRVPVAAFVGRMIRSKGVAHLVAAHERVRSHGIALDLALYGKVDHDNPDALSAETVAAWAKRPGLVWHGHVSDIAEVWRRSDIAVLPAITREGLPRSVLEAAASARPLVVTDVPGCRHVVRDGIEGFVVPPADPEALAAALARLATQPELRLRLGAAARQRVLSAFTVSHVADGVRRAYHGLASR